MFLCVLKGLITCQPIWHECSLVNIEEWGQSLKRGCCFCSCLTLRSLQKHSGQDPTAPLRDRDSSFLQRWVINGWMEEGVPKYYKSTQGCCWNTSTTVEESLGSSGRESSCWGLAYWAWASGSPNMEQSPESEPAGSLGVFTSYVFWYCSLHLTVLLMHQLS